jgi:hypothetical protein
MADREKRPPQPTPTTPPTRACGHAHGRVTQPSVQGTGSGSCGTSRCGTVRSADGMSHSGSTACRGSGRGRRLRPAPRRRSDAARHPGPRPARPASGETGSLRRPRHPSRLPLLRCYRRRVARLSRSRLLPRVARLSLAHPLRSSARDARQRRLATHRQPLPLRREADQAPRRMRPCPLLRFRRRPRMCALLCRAQSRPPASVARPRSGPRDDRKAAQP